MSGSGTKAANRELRKVLGDQAAEMVSSVHDRVTNLGRENEALAVEFAKLRTIQKIDVETLHGRCDGASKWAERNEKDIEKTHADLARLSDHVRESAGRLGALEPVVQDINTRLCAVELGLTDKTGAQHNDTQRTLDAHIHRSLFGRLRWVVFGS